MALADDGDTILLPDPYYPDYPSGLALAGARLQTVPLDPEAGWAPDLDAAPPAAALFLNYPSNPCAVCAPGGHVRGGGSLGRAHRRLRRPRRRLRRSRLRRPPARELPRDAGREGRRRRDVDDVEDLRHGRLAHRLRARQRRGRRADQPVQRPQPRRDLRPAAGCGRRRARRAAGPRSPSASPPTRRAATGSPPRCPCRSSARAPSTSGSGSPRA